MCVCACGRACVCVHPRGWVFVVVLDIQVCVPLQVDPKSEDDRKTAAVHSSCQDRTSDPRCARYELTHASVRTLRRPSLLLKVSYQKSFINRSVIYHENNTVFTFRLFGAIPDLQTKFHPDVTAMVDTA